MIQFPYACNKSMIPAGNLLGVVTVVETVELVVGVVTDVVFSPKDQNSRH